MFIQCKLSGDFALMKALATCVIELDDLLEASGVRREKIEDLAQVCVNSKKVIVTCGMGLTHHKKSVPVIQMLTKRIILRGNI